MKVKEKFVKDTTGSFRTLTDPHGKAFDGPTRRRRRRCFRRLKRCLRSKRGIKRYQAGSHINDVSAILVGDQFYKIQNIF